MRLSGMSEGPYKMDKLVSVAQIKKEPCGSLLLNFVYDKLVEG
ncbi:hypothetical protein M272_10635 [Vibrio natriegens NBRC 15636 = ATCC 14048 = DSM 759]|nr:hypothetical protein M272_10635 [Vibrio natriegens NBRC 15636 = ATCC 14048 = DSM 759]CAH0530904.1 hypothetical protein CTH30272_03249 [Catenococcus thiocycli]